MQARPTTNKSDATVDVEGRRTARFAFSCELKSHIYSTSNNLFKNRGHGHYNLDTDHGTFSVPVPQRSEWLWTVRRVHGMFYIAILIVDPLAPSQHAHCLHHGVRDTVPSSPSFFHPRMRTRVALLLLDGAPTSPPLVVGNLQLCRLPLLLLESLLV